VRTEESPALSYLYIAGGMISSSNKDDLKVPGMFIKQYI
jgi:hypothetical protein